MSFVVRCKKLNKGVFKVGVEKLLKDLRRVDNVRKFNRRGSYNKKEDLKRKKGYKCDYCKQKSKHLNVRLERYHIVKKGEKIQDVADLYNSTTTELFMMNELIFGDKKWQPGLMINIPGDLNVFLSKNGVVSCKDCSYDRRLEKLTHPEYVYHLLNKRKEVRSGVTPEFRKMIYERDQYNCHYCEILGEKTNERLTLDHLVPVVDGGQTTENNVVACCQTHNKAKGTTHYGKFVDKLIKRQIVNNIS